MRVQLMHVKIGKLGLELRVKIIKSENNIIDKGAEFQLLQNTKARGRRYIYTSQSSFKKWKIFDAGTFHFHFSKKMNSITWKVD